MIELYGIPLTIRVFFTILFTLAIIMQTIRLLLMVFHKEYIVRQSFLFYEVFMLLHLILSVMILAMTMLQRNIIAGYFYGFRFIDLIIVALGIWIMLKHRKTDILLCSLLLFTTLPFYSFVYSEYLYLLVNMYFIFRSGVMLEIEWRRIRKSITRLSIKEAVDLFPGGILYANEKGRTLITNPTMNRLLSVFQIDSAINALNLWENLMNLQDSYNVDVQALDDKLLIRIRNGGSWLFSNQTIIVNKKKYTQLLAIDITDEDVLTREMEEMNNTLEEIGCELSSSLKNIEQLEKEREILRMKTRVHDILGQRLSILSRLLESDMEADDIIKSFKPLLTDLTQAITENIDTSPQYLLSSLTQSFALIGTAIHIKGALPTVQEVAMVFAEIIRECATNAVRHSDAGNVYMELQENENKYMLSVRNDGNPPPEHVIEGSGITGMRRQVHELSGEFVIELQPQFQIYIYVPKRRKDDIFD